jgi:hypothetical protein
MANIVRISACSIIRPPSRMDKILNRELQNFLSRKGAKDAKRI